MNFLDLTLPTPAENLACDEALLDEAELHGGAGVLRFWESPICFTVVGYANRVSEEVNVEVCRAQGVPILRRCSGGGTVLQGPGCLNYSVVLPIEETGQTSTITGTNTLVMRRHREALASALGPSVTVEGCTDLAINQLKFSGNAQRRKRHWLLFPGTFLLDFDLCLVDQFLRLPTRQPEYRRHRSHAAFLTQVRLTRDRIKSSLREAWDASARRQEVPRPTIDQLISEKYGKAAWNFKW